MKQLYTADALFQCWHLPAFTVYQVAGACYMITLVIWTRGLKIVFGSQDIGIARGT